MSPTTSPKPISLGATMIDTNTIAKATFFDREKDLIYEISRDYFSNHPKHNRKLVIRDRKGNELTIIKNLSELVFSNYLSCWGNNAELTRFS